MAGLIRSTSNYYGLPIIDCNRVMSVMRDGIDPVSLSFTRAALPSTGSWPATGDEAFGYISVARFDNIPANFWNLQFDLSKRVGNVAEIYDEGGKIAVRWYDSIALLAQIHLSDIDTPPAGSNVILHRKVDALTMRIELYVVGSQFDGVIGSQIVFEGPSIKGGAKFSPELRHTIADPAVTVVHTYYPGEPELYLPEIFDDEIWIRASDLSEGNQVNHPNAFAQNAIYQKALSYQELSAPEQTSLLELGDQEVLDLNGEEGIIFNFKTMSFGRRASNGDISKGAATGPFSNLPGTPHLDDNGEPVGVRITSGSSSPNLNLNNIGFNSDEGTFIIEFMAEKDGTGIEVALLGVNQVGERIQITAPTDTTEFDADTARVIYFDGALQANHEMLATPFDQMTRVSTSWKQDAFDSNIDGFHALADFDGNVPNAANGGGRLWLAGNGGTDITSTIIVSRIEYYPRKMSSTELLRAGKL